MSEVQVLERSEVTSSFAGAADKEPSEGEIKNAGINFSDADKRHYVEERERLRGRVIDGLNKMRSFENDQKKFKRQMTFDFVKAGLGISMNTLKSLKSPGGMISWAFNMFETGLQIAHAFKNNAMAKIVFERDKMGYQGAIKDAIIFNRNEAPLDAYGKTLKTNFAMFVPDDIAAKYVPEVIAHKDMNTGAFIENVSVREMRPDYNGPFGTLLKPPAPAPTPK